MKKLWPVDRWHNVNFRIDVFWRRLPGDGQFFYFYIMTKSNIIKGAVFLCVFTGLIYWGNYLGSREFYKNILEQRKEEAYSGVVQEKYVDSSEHCTPVLKFEGGDTTYIENELWDQIKEGDSVVKINGEYYISVYRKSGEILKLSYIDYFD